MAFRAFHNIFAAVDGMPELIDADLAWLDELREGCDVVASAILHAGWIEADLRSLDTAGGQLIGVRKLVACKDDQERRVLLSDPDSCVRFRMNKKHWGREVVRADSPSR